MSFSCADESAKFRTIEGFDQRIHLSIPGDAKTTVVNGQDFMVLSIDGLGKNKEFKAMVYAGGSPGKK
jgi:hypothetical protein